MMGRGTALATVALLATTTLAQCWRDLQRRLQQGAQQQRRQWLG
jgi:hypothetical protein